jgi:hypothetical protein
MITRITMLLVILFAMLITDARATHASVGAEEIGIEAVEGSIFVPQQNTNIGRK